MEYNCGGLTMVLSSVSMVGGQWIIKQLASKGFNHISSKLSEDDLNTRLKNAITKIARELQIKYPTVLDGNIDQFFREEELFSELITYIPDQCVTR